VYVRRRISPFNVIPAQAGIQAVFSAVFWTPAFAGATKSMDM